MKKAMLLLTVLMVVAGCFGGTGTITQATYYTLEYELPRLQNTTATDNGRRAESGDGAFLPVGAPPGIRWPRGRRHEHRRISSIRHIHEENA